MLTWPRRKLGEDPLDFDINWLPRLYDPRTGITDTIANSAWAIVSGTGLTINSNSFTTARTKVWLSGGTLGQTYLLKNTITSAGGRTEIETTCLPGTSIVVEDGTGMANANSYASEDMLNAYCASHGIALVDEGDAEAALIRGTQYIEGNYRGRWPGARVKYRGLQSLSWPRYGAYANNESRVNYSALQLSGGAYADSAYPFNIGYLIQPNEIPIEVIYATCEAAIRELLIPGYLQPDLTLTNIKNERAGDTEFEYFQGRGAIPLVTVIEGILSSILLSRTDLFGVRDRMS